MPKTYNLKLTGFVGGSQFNLRLVNQTLDAFPGSPVNVLIDSRGGDLATALSIAAAFKAHGDVSVHFVGLNASAATIAALGAKHTSIDSNAMYLVHKCSVEFFEWASVNADSLEAIIDKCSKQKANLDKIDQNIASMYADKCKRSVDDLMAIMKVGGWISAQEALEYGFVDSIDNAVGSLSLTAEAVADFMAQGIDLPAGFGSSGSQDIFSRIGKVLRSFMSAISPAEAPASDVSSVSKSKAIAMNTEILNKAVGCDVSAAADGSVTLSPDQTKKLTDKINADAERIAELEAQVAELGAADGDSSDQITDESKEAHKPSKKKEDADSVDCFIKTQAAAAKLFNSLP